MPAGVLKTAVAEVVVLPFNDPDGAEALIDQNASELAGVLVEPIMGVAGMVPATKEFLQRLRDVTARHGIVLIYDEVVTFPVAYGGAQAHFGVLPDLTTLSKSIGGGLPLGAVGGKAEIMNLLDPQLNDGKAPGCRRLDVRRQPGRARRRPRVPLAAHSRGACEDAGAWAESARRHRRARPHLRHPTARDRLRPPVRDALGAGAGVRLRHAPARTTGRRSSTSASR